MSPSSQSGPNYGPSSSPSRRLQTPEERFGFHVEPEPEVEAEPEAPDPFVPLPPSGSARAARSKSRHERRRFDREAHRIEPRRTRRPSHPAHIPVAHLTPDESHLEEGDVIDASAEKANREGEASLALARIRAKRRTFWKRVGMVVLAFAVAGASGAALYAPQMNIEKVEISGLHATAPVLAKPIAGRLIGHNVIRADKKGVARSMERLPTVASARVVMHPEWPPRVEVQVVERKPMMRVGVGGAWWVADKAGTPYRTANAHDKSLPALTWGEPIETFKPLNPKRWTEAMRLAQAVEANLGQTGMTSLADIRSMQLDANGDASMVLASQGGAPELTLRLGNDEWDEKLAKARTARLYLARTHRQAAELNLISLDLPRWKPRAAEVSSTPVPAT